MNKYIAFYGFEPKRDVVWAADEAAALTKAREFAVADGMSAEEAQDPDYVFVRVWDSWLARDHGLMFLDERGLGYQEVEARA